MSEQRASVTPRSSTPSTWSNVAPPLLAVAIKQSGARVYACGSVEEALDVAGRVAIDAIVSDIGMPGEEGYSLIAQVRARLDRDVVALALTGFAGGKDRAAALTAGFDDHLAKPASPGAVTARIARLLRVALGRAMSFSRGEDKRARRAPARELGRGEGL